MPRDLRSERHYAIEDFGGCSCSLGLPKCACFAACEQPDEWEPVPDSEAIWMMLPFIAVWCLAVALFIMVVFP